MSESPALRARLIKEIKESLSICTAAGYEAFTVEEMLEGLLEVVEELFGKDGTASTSPDAIEKLFQADDMNYPICYLRCCTSSYMKTHGEDFAPFLVEHASVADFCMREVGARSARGGRGGACERCGLLHAGGRGT